MRTSFFLVVFLIISLVHLLSEFYGWSPVVFWTKILLMPLLILALWQGSTKIEINKPIQLALLALVFSTAGDLFLLVEKTRNQEIYFYLGLGSFLLAQISYCFSFLSLGHQRRTCSLEGYISSLLPGLYPLVAPCPAPGIVDRGNFIRSLADSDGMEQLENFDG